MYMYIVIKTGGVVGFVGQVEKFFFFLQQLLSSGAGAVCSALADHRMERKGSPYLLAGGRLAGCGSRFCGSATAGLLLTVVLPTLVVL